MRGCSGLVPLKKKDDYSPVVDCYRLQAVDDEYVFVTVWEGT